MIIYLVRHGQTDFNKNHQLQGRVFDEPLNSDGIKEINDLLPNLPKDFEVIYSSQHKRVLESAEIISNYSGKPIIINKNLEERDFGSLDGKTWNDIPGGHELQLIDIKQQYDYRQYGGESVEDVAKRFQTFLEEVKRSPYDISLVVSSVGVVRLFYKILLNEVVADIQNASVHKFEIL
jgi:broad specificity phosphatase PhoE